MQNGNYPILTLDGTSPTAAKHGNYWMFLGISLLILGCLTIAATPGGNRTIRAKEFILEDANGKTRASLNMLENLPRLCLAD